MLNLGGASYTPIMQTMFVYLTISSFWNFAEYLSLSSKRESMAVKISIRHSLNKSLRITSHLWWNFLLGSPHRSTVWIFLIWKVKVLWIWDFTTTAYERCNICLYVSVKHWHGVRQPHLFFHNFASSLLLSSMTDALWIYVTVSVWEANRTIRFDLP